MDIDGVLNIFPTNKQRRERRTRRGHLLGFRIEVDDDIMAEVSGLFRDFGSSWLTTWNEHTALFADFANLPDIPFLECRNFEDPASPQWSKREIIETWAHDHPGERWVFVDDMAGAMSESNTDDNGLILVPDERIGIDATMIRNIREHLSSGGQSPEGEKA